MRWIKASERLPEENKQVISRLSGECYRIQNCNGKIFFGSTDIQPSKSDFLLIEWLDESEPTPDQINALAEKEYPLPPIPGWQSDFDVWIVERKAFIRGFNAALNYKK